MNRVFRGLRSPFFIYVAWLLLGIALLYLAIRQVNFLDVVQTLSNARLFYVVLGIISVGLNVLAKAIRWRILIGNSGKHISFTQILFALILGQMLNWFMPGRVGDLARIYLIGKRGPGNAHTFATVALEKMMDLVGYLGLFALTATFLFPLPGWINRPGIPLLVFLICIIAGIGFISLTSDRWMQVINHSVRLTPGSIWERVLQGIQSILKSVKLLSREKHWASLLIWTVVAWFTAVLTNHLAGLALNLRLPATGSVVLLVALQAGISLPGIPGKIGVFQYICVLVLALFDLNQQISLSYGILLQALVMLPVTLAGLGYMIWRGSDLGATKHLKGFSATRENI